MKTQIKVFEAYDSESLQHEVNRWLSTMSRLSIIQETNVVVSSKNDSPLFVLMILYRTPD